MITQGPSSLLAAAQDGSPLASSSAPPEAVSEQRTRRMRGQKRKRLMDVKGGVVSSAPLALKRTSGTAE